MTTERAISDLGTRLGGLVLREEDGCLTWLGARDIRAGCRLAIGGKRTSVGRWAWYLSHGAWPTRPVYRSCGNVRCLRHLALRPMRGKTVSDSEARDLVLARVADVLNRKPTHVVRALDEVVAA